jgi:hypothetical protein
MILQIKNRLSQRYGNVISLGRYVILESFGIGIFYTQTLRPMLYIVNRDNLHMISFSLSNGLYTDFSAFFKTNKSIS